MSKKRWFVMRHDEDRGYRPGSATRVGGGHKTAEKARTAADKLKRQRKRGSSDNYTVRQGTKYDDHVIVDGEKFDRWYDADGNRMQGRWDG